MARFHYGFLTGNGDNTQFQLWNEVVTPENYRCESIDTSEIDKIIGKESRPACFHGARYLCHQKCDNVGFVVNGFNKEEVEKLATLFIDYLSRAKEGFRKVPPIIKER